MQYTVKKHYVQFDCPACGECLNTELKDAGKKDHCPVCRALFISPGIPEWKAEQSRQAEKNAQLELKNKEKRDKKSATVEQRQIKREAALAEREARTAIRAAELGAKTTLVKAEMADVEASQPIAASRRKNRRWVVSIACVVAALVAYKCLGLFVIQPIGAVPEGATIVYWRLGLNLPFVASADSLQLEVQGRVSLLGRGMALAAVAEPIADRKIITLPYSRSLYLHSTGGREYE